MGQKNLGLRNHMQVASCKILFCCRHVVWLNVIVVLSATTRAVAGGWKGVAQSGFSFRSSIPDAMRAGLSGQS